MPPRRAPSVSTSPSRAPSPPGEDAEVSPFDNENSCSLKVITFSKACFFDTVDELQQHVGVMTCFHCRAYIHFADMIQGINVQDILKLKVLPLEY